MRSYQVALDAAERELKALEGRRTYLVDHIKWLRIHVDLVDAGHRPLWQPKVEVERPRGSMNCQEMWSSLAADMEHIVDKGGAMWGCAKWALALIETEVGEPGLHAGGER